jgi:putative ABC transport system permease protein
MNRPRWQKVFSDLWSNRARSLLVIASILVGLFAIGVIANMYILIRSDMQAGYAATNPANIFISASLYDKSLLDHVQRLPGVRQAEGSRNFSLRLQSGPGEWINVKVMAVPDFGAMQINQVSPVMGQWPPQDRQIVLDNGKAKNTKAQVGDMITFELPSGDLRQLKFVGEVKDQSVGASGSGSGGYFAESVHAYVTQDTLEWLEQPAPSMLNTMVITVDGNGNNISNIDQISTLIASDLKKNGLTISSNSARGSSLHPNQDLVQAISGVLFMLGLLVVFLSGFLITNTLQALLEQQVQQIGIMKSVGARRWQIVQVYMVLILVYGLVAFALAVPLAYQVSGRIVGLLANQLNFTSQGAQWIPGVIVLLGILALVVPQVAAFLPIWKGTGISVQEALSGIRQGAKSQGGWLDDRIANIRRFSRPIRIAIRNVIRRKGRLILTLITLTMGGAIFIATFGVQVSMQRFVYQIGRYFLADVNVTFARPYRVDEIQQLISSVPGVKYMEAWSSARAQVLLPDGTVGQDVTMLAPPADSHLVEPVLIEGRWIQPGDQNAIVLNELFQSRYPDLKVGDTLRLQINNEKKDWKVVGFFRFAGKVTGFLSYTNYDYLTQITGQFHQAIMYRIVSDNPHATLQSQTALANTIDTLLRKNNYAVADISAGSDAVKKSAGGFGILTGFLLFLAGLIALVGSIGLAGTMSMNVMERTREIGVLRAIGATNRILMRMVVVEGMLIGMISWVFAALLSFPIGKLISDSITQAVFGAPSQPGYPPSGFAIWLGVVVVLSILASVMPARSAAQLTIREVLSYE